MLRRRFLLLAVLLPLAGCDQLGLEAASVTAARVEADGKAVGAACRHGGRAIEDCFALNRKVDKAAIYAGWREMDDYMRENKIEAVLPSLGQDARPPKTADASEATDAAAATAKADKAADKPTEKSAKADKAGSAKVDKAAAGKPDKAEKVAKADKPAAPVDGDKPPAEH
jgi:hypothetical protein